MSILKTNLLVRQSLQTGCLMGTGDVIAQTLMEKKARGTEYDLSRTAKFFLLGTVFVGPVVGCWYKCLDMFGKSIEDKSSTSVVLKKVFLDQAVFAPCSLAVFMTILNFLEGGNSRSAKKEIKEKYLDILLTNYKVWPAVQMINFYFVPLKHQVLLAQSVGLLWNSYLSWKIHN